MKVTYKNAGSVSLFLSFLALAYLGILYVLGRLRQRILSDWVVQQVAQGAECLCDLPPPAAYIALSGVMGLLGFLAISFFLAGAAVLFLFQRCPHCSKFIRPSFWNASLPDYCASCGERLEK